MSKATASSVTRGTPPQNFWVVEYEWEGGWYPRSVGGTHSSHAKAVAAMNAILAQYEGDASGIYRVKPYGPVTLKKKSRAAK